MLQDSQNLCALVHGGQPMSGQQRHFGRFRRQRSTEHSQRSVIYGQCVAWTDEVMVDMARFGSHILTKNIN